VTSPIKAKYRYIDIFMAEKLLQHPAKGNLFLCSGWLPETT